MRVLIADDCPDTRRLYSKLLELHGYQPHAVENGNEAVQAATAADPFDVILMDIHMPRCDGIEATRELRDRGYKGVIYAFTGVVRAELQQTSELENFDDCVSKPISQEQIVELLRKLKGVFANKLGTPAAKDNESSRAPK